MKDISDKSPKLLDFQLLTIQKIEFPFPKNLADLATLKPAAVNDFHFPVILYIIYIDNNK
ncbi:MAG: hypothetical protein QWI36_04790 [Wolbachia endosymbiont of Tyrophagus putrescentiae]|nr:hypothetical protein [Wolbachia endosymbiont of Tyrophagus putrescentiae]